MDRGESGHASEIAKEIGNLLIIEEDQAHMACKFLLGNLKTVGHRDDLINRPLLMPFYLLYLIQIWLR